MLYANPTHDLKGAAMSARPCGLTRREFLAAAACAAAGAGLGSPARTSAAETAAAEEPSPMPAADRPSILFILTDDQRWDTLGCMGNRIIRTPNIDALAARGVVFDNAFVTTSICMTSRASFFTGCYARCHGVTNFQSPLSPAMFALSYPERLRAAGYRTGFSGKYGVGPVPKDGFDYNKGFPGQGHYFPESPAAKMKPQQAGELAGPHQNELMASHAEEFLDGCRKGQPFCLSLSFKSAHCQDGDPRQFLYEPDLEDLYADVEIPPPPTADPKYFDAFPEFIRRGEVRTRWNWRFSTPEKYQSMVKAYYRLITGMDRAVGRIIKSLEARGMAESTVIVFAGDNGFYLGEHGFAGKWLPHEESIRVPLVVYDPRLPAAARGRRVAEMALNIDVAPTLLDLAGLPVPAAMNGRSLAPLLRGESPPWRTEWFYEHPPLGKIIPEIEGLRTRRAMYARYPQSDPVFEELYDLASDPHQTTNLAASDAGRGAGGEGRGAGGEGRGAGGEGRGVVDRARDVSRGSRSTAAGEAANEASDEAAGRVVPDLAAMRARCTAWRDALAAWTPDDPGPARALTHE
jgi:arylsulfatase A-like enzyme